MLEIEFYSGKGEVDIIIFVRRDDEIFRPTISRSFDLLKVARYVKGDNLESFKELFPNKVYANDEQNDLAYCSEISKRYCIDIFRGDLSKLEYLHMERRERSK